MSPRIPYTNALLIAQILVAQSILYRLFSLKRT
jgi:hypothetical protein